MNARTPNAFFLSGALHVLVVGLFLLLTYSFRSAPEKPAKIFELVAGAGDNYMATAAPKLGDPGSVKFDSVTLPTIKPQPVAPEAPAPAPTPEPAVTPKPEPAPVAKEKVPTPPPATKKDIPAKTTPLKTTPTTKPTLEQNPLRYMQNKVANGEAAAKRQVAKDRAAAEKAAAAQAAIDKKFERIDTAGIRAGVIGGSIDNKTGGAGGKALTVEERGEAENYAAMLISRLQDYLNSTPGLDDGLRAEVQVRILSDGRLVVVRTVTSSKNAAFDQAVLRAIASVSMPVRPKGLDELQTIPFSTRAKN